MRTKTLLLMGFIALVAAQVNAASIRLGPQVGYYKAHDDD